MTAPETYPTHDAKAGKIALLVGLACVLQISESLIPHPVPGLRLGLANMMTLIALVDLGFSYALEVAILRTVLSSFILGTFMSPTFLLSLGGAVISSLVMGLFYFLSGLSRLTRLSIIGISIIGAFVHNVVQLGLAYVLWVKHPGIFVFLPWLSLGAIATGWVVGMVAGGVCRSLRDETVDAASEVSCADEEEFRLRIYCRGHSPVHRLPAEIKLSVLMVLALSLLFISHAVFFMGCFALLVALLPLSGTPVAFYLMSARKYMALIVISLFLPLMFNSGTHVLMTLGSVRITDEGFRTGVLYASRILLLILFSALLMRTTSPPDLVSGLEKLLWPLRFVGIRHRRMAGILSQAWTSIPRLWETTRRAIFASDLGKIQTLKGLLPALIHVIATLYVKTEYPRGPARHVSPRELGDRNRPSAF